MLYFTRKRHNFNVFIDKDIKKSMIIVCMQNVSRLVYNFRLLFILCVVIMSATVVVAALTAEIVSSKTKLMIVVTIITTTDPDEVNLYMFT